MRKPWGDYWGRDFYMYLMRFPAIGLGTAFSHCFCVVVYLPVYRVSYRLVSWVRDQRSQLAGWAKKKLGWLRCARNVVQGVVDRVRVEDHETFVQSHVED